MYNLVMAATFWGGSAWIWSLSSIWIAFVTWFLLKRGLLDIKKPGTILFGGVLLGLTNALITFQITVFIFNGLPTYEPTAVLNAFFFNATKSREIAAFIEHIIVELIDKTAHTFSRCNRCFLFAKNLNDLNDYKRKSLTKREIAL